MTDQERLCDRKCVKKLDKALVDAYGPTVQIELETVINLKPGKSLYPVLPIKFSYQPVRNGKPTKRRVSATTVGKYCPLCGGKVPRG